MNAHWVKFSERRPPNESKKYVIAFGGWSKEYHLTFIKRNCTCSS